MLPHARITMHYWWCMGISNISICFLDFEFFYLVYIFASSGSVRCYACNTSHVNQNSVNISQSEGQNLRNQRLNWYLRIADYEIMSLTLVNKSMIVTVKIMSCRLNLFILITLFEQYLCKKHTSARDARIVKTCTIITFFI